MNGRPVRATGSSPLLARPRVVAALVGSSLALTGWAVVVLIADRAAVVPVLVGLGAAVAAVRLAGRERADAAVVRALVEHADPGPDLRARAAAWAHGALHPRASDRWGPPAVVTGMAAACVVVAVVRSSWPVALPAPFLLAWAAAHETARRLSTARASRWLDDPPVPADDADDDPA